MAILVHLACAAAATFLAAESAAQPTRAPEPAPAERKQPLTRELEELERELRKSAESVRKAASRAEELAKEEAEKRLPELRKSLGELRRGLEAALEDLDDAIEDGERPVAEGTITKLEGRALTLKSPTGGATTLELDEQTLVRREGSRVSILALHTGTTVRVRYEKQGGRLVARRIEILPAAK